MTLVVHTREYTAADWLKRLIQDAGFRVDDASFERAAQELLRDDDPGNLRVGLTLVK